MRERFTWQLQLGQMKQDINTVFLLFFIYKSLKHKQQEKPQGDYIHWDFCVYTKIVYPTS